MPAGIPVTEADEITVADWLLGIEGGTSGRVSFASLATQLAGSGAVYEALLGKVNVPDLDAALARISSLEALGGAVSAPAAEGGPVAVATTENITLSGEQTIDGVLTSANRVLVKNQTVPAENGIYLSAAGPWARATDMDAAGEVQATSVFVTGGTTNGGRTYATYSVVTTLGTDPIAWVLVQDQSGLAEAVAGKAEAGHTHPVAEVTGLQTALDAKAATSDIKRGTVIVASVDPASTDSNLILTGPLVPRYPEVDAKIKFVADRNMVPLDDDESPFDGEITAQMKDAAGNLGGRYKMSPVSGGAVSHSMIKNRGTYTLTWTGAPGNSYRLAGYGDQAFGKATSGILIASAVGGTADAIVLTTDYGPVDRSIVLFKAAATNATSTPTVAITSSQTGATSPATQIRYAKPADTVRPGDIEKDRWHGIMYDASLGNPWILFTSGVTLGDVKAVADAVIALEARVTALEAASGSSVVFANEAIALMDKINGPRIDNAAWDTSLRNPDHTTGASTGTTRISWSDGVRTEEAPAIIKSLGFGSSIDDTGAGSGDAATYTPSVMFVDKLRKRFAFYRNIDFQQDNVAVGGQTIGQMLAQIQGAAAGDYDIIVGGNPMNSGGIADTAGGATMRSFRAALENVVDEIRDVRNAVPILTPTFHPHIFYDTSGGTNPQQLIDNYRVAWPRGNTTYQVTGNHEFDAAGGRIKLINISLYGSTLADGDTLYVPSGSGAGTYTIAAAGIDWATSWVNVNEPVPFTGTYSVQVTNRAADEERVVWPPDSERIQTIDRTGNGVAELPGWITYDETNRIYHEVGHIKDCMIADLEHAQFLFLERKWAANPAITDSDLYDTMYVQGGVRQANHPNAEFYGFAYGGVWSTFANLVHRRALHQHRVIRMA